MFILIKLLYLCPVVVLRDCQCPYKTHTSHILNITSIMLCFRVIRPYLDIMSEIQGKLTVVILF